MIKNLSTKRDRYDKKKPGNLLQKQLINPVYENPHPDYFISNELKHHILSGIKISANQKIKIFESNLNINTYLKILKLQLSFIINNRLLDPKSKNKRNYKFIFDISLVNYRQKEGIFENLEEDLYWSIKKIAQMIYEHAPKKLLDLSDYNNSYAVLNKVLNYKSEQFLNYISALISIINAKGKYEQVELNATGYKKNLDQEKSHIPYFKIEKQDLKIKLRIQDPHKITPEEKVPPRESGSPKNNSNQENIKGRNVYNSSGKNSFSNGSVHFSLKKQAGGLAYRAFSLVTSANRIVSLSIIFVLVTILVLLISMLIS